MKTLFAAIAAFFITFGGVSGASMSMYTTTPVTHGGPGGPNLYVYCEDADSMAAGLWVILNTPGNGEFLKFLESVKTCYDGVTYPELAIKAEIIAYSEQTFMGSEVDEAGEPRRLVIVRVKTTDGRLFYSYVSAQFAPGGKNS